MRIFVIMIRNALFGIYIICSIACGIGYYTALQTVKEQELIISNQNAALQIKKMELEELNKSITLQNSKINEYNNNADEYAKQIAILNQQLEVEISKHYMREQMTNPDSSDKEAIEWLRIKRNSISF